MATQGMVSIIKNRVVIGKVTAGDNGMKAKETAHAILKHLSGNGLDPAMLLVIAKLQGLGCEACRVAVIKAGDKYKLSTSEGDYYDDIPDDDATYGRWCRTLQDVNFNPRWECGVIDHAWVADLDKHKAYKARNKKKGKETT